MKEKYIELARKLKRLADEGVGGEKDNAEEKLKLIMEKYDISFIDIEGAERKIYNVNFHKEIPVKFILQVLSSIVGNLSKYDVGVTKYKYVRKKNHLYYRINNIEPQHFAEFVIKVPLFWKDYNEQLKLFYSAYIQKNGLYMKPSEDDDNKPVKPLTPEEKTEIYKMSAMMEGIDRAKYQKRLD
jgi:hypothetical protein